MEQVNPLVSSVEILELLRAVDDETYRRITLQLDAPFAGVCSAIRGTILTGEVDTSLWLL